MFREFNTEPDLVRKFYAQWIFLSNIYSHQRESNPRNTDYQVRFRLRLVACRAT